MIYIITSCGDDIYDRPEIFLATTDKNKATEKLSILRQNRGKVSVACKQLSEYSRTIAYNKNYNALYDEKRTKLLNHFDLSKEEFELGSGKISFEIVEMDDNW
jgi:hypothetical protein